MARKNDWKKRNKRKVIDLKVEIEVSEGDIHLWICDMLQRGLEITHSSLMADIKDILKHNGQSFFDDPGGIPQEYEPYVFTARALFKEFFGFAPSQYHPWLEGYMK